MCCFSSQAQKKQQKNKKTTQHFLEVSSTSKGPLCSIVLHLRIKKSNKRKWMLIPVASFSWSQIFLIQAAMSKHHVVGSSGYMEVHSAAISFQAALLFMWVPGLLSDDALTQCLLVYSCVISRQCIGFVCQWGGGRFKLMENVCIVCTAAVLCVRRSLDPDNVQARELCHCWCRIAPMHYLWSVTR